MLGKSDFAISDAIGAFAERGVEAAYLVPTPTGLAKAIIDAHSGIRYFLKQNGFHDFDLQGLGNTENGVKIDIHLVHENGVTPQKLSLYRPKTKSGDPRLWTNLKAYCEPFNLLAMFVGSDGLLYLANCSNKSLFESISTPGSTLNQITLSKTKPASTQLLLDKLREIALQGWVAATRHGDTGVGHTLETLLGIEANSSKRPDFLDEIELKSSRMPNSGRSANKSTMLSKVPNWKATGIRAADILAKFGEVSDASGRRELYVTVSEKPNRQGLVLVYNESAGSIEVRHITADGSSSLVAVWAVADLQEDLRNKHRETFWVKAERRVGSEGLEQFRFVKVTRTLRPMVANVGPLINVGKITLDLTLSEKPSGGVRDHGYLFRIWPKDLGFLFPAVENYELI